MPVLDHDVHPSTRIGTTDFRWGCWNLPRPKVGQVVYGSESHQVWGYNFSTECRNDFSLTDKFCEGCQWRGTGEEYDNMVRREGK